MRFVHSFDYFRVTRIEGMLLDGIEGMLLDDVQVMYLVLDWVVSGDVLPRRQV